MDTNYWRPNQGASGTVGDYSIESGDWRAQIEAVSRERIVNKIMDTLKRHLPFSGHEGLQELKKIAVRFEEKIYTAATSQSDYLRKISLKMLTMETRPQNPMPDALPSNSAANSINPSNPGSQVMPQVNNQGKHLPISGPSNHTQPGKQKTDTSDWRVQLHADSRQRMMNKITNTLKRQLPFSEHERLPELKKVAVRFEEKIYTAATSQSDYLWKISMKMLTAEDILENILEDANNVNPSVPASLDSTTQTGNLNGEDWQEEVYQKIKTMKDLYLPDLNDMHQKIIAKLQQHDSLPQQPKNQQLEKLKVFKNMLERFMQFLQIPKHGILASYKDKLSTYEKQIVLVINSNRRRSTPPQQQQQALPPPHMQSVQQSQQAHSQLTQVQSHESQMNLKGSMTAMPHNMGSLQQNSVSNSQQNMMYSIQPSCNLDPGQSSTVNSLQQVSGGTLQQNGVSGTEQVNIKPMSLQQNADASGANGDLESGDWRTQLHVDSRTRIVNKLLDTLKTHIPSYGAEGLQELKSLAESFEENYYTAATSQSDYLKKLAVKMLNLETGPQYPVLDEFMRSRSTANSVNP